MFTLAKRQQLGNYIITFQVKEGDYAETYRVKDADGKNRFLKLINCAKLHRTQFDANGNILEVQIAKTLNHPNVVKYHDNGEVVLDGRKFAYIVFDISVVKRLHSTLLVKGVLVYMMQRLSY